MNEDERWAYLVSLDDELLVGGVMLSEWCSLIVREADIAFVKGANLAAILTAVCAIETHLRADSAQKRRARLTDLIDQSSLDSHLCADLHKLRTYRNRWVHVSDPWDDQVVLAEPERLEKELDDFAVLSMRVLRQVLYDDQCV